mmetsp:Transcript_13310/g.23903  ORF Transcript_13310/g.23903 Transcript_13310/m.23903 type:complete len:161 (-) Transcript_13310:759-1241(-)
MRLVVQRVAQASVTGGGETSSIGRGLLVLVGMESTDTSIDSEFCLKKLIQLKLFPENSNSNDTESDKKSNRWSKNVVDLGLEILLVSQFTLYAVYKGSKPSFHKAMNPEISNPFYYKFVDDVRSQYIPERVKTCVFGSYMNVSLVNDGPVTLIIDSKSKN